MRFFFALKKEKNISFSSETKARRLTWPGLSSFVNLWIDFQVIKYGECYSRVRSVFQLQSHPGILLVVVIDVTVYPGVTLTAGTLWCFRELLTFAMACITESYMIVAGCADDIQWFFLIGKLRVLVQDLTAAILLAMTFEYNRIPPLRHFIHFGMLLLG
ncbi:hypothetical protein NC652_015162 [Populus alba x Populus x berolinensis]|nr:hypothetical protein NC652_015162 [Populus alba x Populus x berolinensis]